jgi:hypothetical protein
MRGRSGAAGCEVQLAWVVVRLLGSLISAIKLALALSGRREEAIAEFENFVEKNRGSNGFSQDIVARRKWIELFRSGGNPFADGIK